MMKRAICALLFILAGSAICSAQQFTYYFPHVAVGGFPGGAWQTTIFITNTTLAPASGTISFITSGGTPMNAIWLDDASQLASSGNVVAFAMGPQETRKYVSVASIPLTTGFARVSASAAVIGTGMFTQFDGNGIMRGEAGVPPAIPLARQAIFVDTLNGFRTGVAIANPNNAPLQITFQLVGTSGALIGQVQNSVPPNQHIAFFVDELFPGAPPTVGRLQFWCFNPMTSVGFRFDPSGALFTTLPPVAVQ